MAGNWISVNAPDDVAGSIRHILHTAKLVSVEPLAWKWIVLALHSALQGACVCHLTTSAEPLGAVTKHNAKEWLTYFEASRENRDAKPPKTVLMTLPNLLKAVRKPHSAGDRSNDVGITLSDAELLWLRGFHNNIRNQFVHFEPRGWSIEVSGIPEISILVARIIEEILDIGYAFRHQDRRWQNEMRRNLKILGSLKWLPT